VRLPPKNDLRLNEDHPPLAKCAGSIAVVLARVPRRLLSRSWTISESSSSLRGTWVVGALAHDQVEPTFDHARVGPHAPVSLTLLLGWVLCGLRTAPWRNWGGAAVLGIFGSTPAFLVCPLVHTDVSVLFFPPHVVAVFAKPGQAPVARNAVLLET